MFKSGYIGGLFFTLWLGLHPFINGADAPTTPLPPTAAEQWQTRADALRRAKREAATHNLDFAAIKRRWAAKAKALQALIDATEQRHSVVEQLAARERLRRDNIVSIKARALAEAKEVAKFVREREEAEKQAVEALLKQMELENPNFRDQALRLARQSAEAGPGSTVQELVDLPELEGALPMTYQQYLPPDPNRLVGGHTSFAKTVTGVPAAASRLARNEAVRRLSSVQNPDFNEAVQREVSKREALQKIVDIAKKARAAEKQDAAKSIEQRKQELLDKYLKNEITATEYYEARAKLRGQQ